MGWIVTARGKELGATSERIIFPRLYRILGMPAGRDAARSPSPACGTGARRVADRLLPYVPVYGGG
jgi:hypothetical protein